MAARLARDNPHMIPSAQIRLLIALTSLLGPTAWAGPFIPAGDLALCHDIQRLADAGVIDVGAGYEKIDDSASGVSYSVGRFYLQWRSAY